MTPMKMLIIRLFSDAESKEINNPLVAELRKELPANAKPSLLECQLVLKSGYAAAGVLTTTNEDTLRLASIAQTPDKKVMMVDQYFSYDDVETIATGRPLEIASVTPIRNGSPIILGH
jgi:hypothetical protein